MCRRNLVQDFCCIHESISPKPDRCIFSLKERLCSIFDLVDPIFSEVLPLAIWLREGLVYLESPYVLAISP